MSALQRANFSKQPREALRDLAEMLDLRCPVSHEPNTIRQCEQCGQIGRQNRRQTRFRFYTLREVVCANPRCRKVRTNLELFLGLPVGPGQKIGQAQLMLNALMKGTVTDATNYVENLNERFAELAKNGLTASTNAVRTCPSCAEPGQARYSSNYGPFVVHGYVCTDKECRQRWLACEFPLAPTTEPLTSLAVCIEKLREAAVHIKFERQARMRERRAAYQALQEERARLIQQITRQRPIVRLTDEQIRTTCRELLAQGLRPSLDELRAELGKRYGRVGWRRQVAPIWESELGISFP